MDRIYGYVEENNAIEYSDDLSVWSAYFGIPLLERFNLDSGRKILDIGCGTGFPSLEIAARIKGAGVIYALDPWEKGLERLIKIAEIRKLDNIIPLKNSVECIPLRENTIDFIISNNGMNACKEKEKGFKECFRVLKKGGRMTFTILLPDSMAEINSIFYQTLCDMKYDIYKIKNNLFRNRIDINDYRKIFERVGFNEKNIENRKFQIKFINGEAFINYFMFRILFYYQWSICIKTKDREEVFKQYVENLNRYAKKNNGIEMKIEFAVIEIEKNKSIGEK